MLSKRNRLLQQQHPKKLDFARHGGSFHLRSQGKFRVALSINGETCHDRAEVRQNECAANYMADPEGSGACLPKNYMSICDNDNTEVFPREKKDFSKDSVLVIKTGSMAETEQFELSLVPNTTKIPLKRGNTSVYLQALGHFDLQIKNKRTGESCAELKDIHVASTCSKDQVMTDEGFCTRPKLVASVQSNSLDVELLKASFSELEINSTSTISSREVLISPSANYNINLFPRSLQILPVGDASMSYAHWVTHDCQESSQ